MTNVHQGRRTFLRSRRRFVRLGLASRLDLLNFIADASAQTATDYKALVCVFMFGGNDGNNTVIPIDTAGYGQYAAVRTGVVRHPAGAGLAAADSATQSRRLRTDCIPADRAADAVQPAQDGDPRQRRHAAQPTTKAQYNAGVRPLSLYSHADQQAQWQSSISNAASARAGAGASPTSSRR